LIVTIRRARRRRVILGARAGRPEATPELGPLVGARAPGVRARRRRQPRELDWNERLREGIQARRGISRGATVWRT
jgi:hypothetical protein